jgi:hypothetical protein
MASTTTSTGGSRTSFFSFPNPVNDVAARTVATGVVVMALLVAGLGWGWVLVAGGAGTGGEVRAVGGGGGAV